MTDPQAVVSPRRDAVRARSLPLRRHGRDLHRRDGPLGFTCQSFSSLSLDPPLIAIFPARTSSTWPHIRDTGRFCVNVLSQHQAELSGRFARRGADRFDGVEWSSSPLGSPLLAGVVAWIDCTLWREYDGGDHTIVAGQVEHLGAISENGPLAFHRGSYAQLPT